jgi:hypothetical protein
MSRGRQNLENDYPDRARHGQLTCRFLCCLPAWPKSPSACNRQGWSLAVRPAEGFGFPAECLWQGGSHLLSGGVSGAITSGGNKKIQVAGWRNRYLGWVAVVRASFSLKAMLIADERLGGSGTLEGEAKVGDTLIEEGTNRPDDATAIEPVDIGEPEQIDPNAIAKALEEWRAGTELLRQMFTRSSHGCVSSMALRKELDRQGLADARQLVIKMKFFDFTAPPEAARPTPGLRWRHHGKSFYTEEAFNREMHHRESAAESAAELAVDDPEPIEAELGVEPEVVRARRGARQEEARLVRYVVDALRDIYDSDCAPDRCEVAFDVHSERGGSEYENVDAIGIHWRSSEVVDLAAVEVKLDFSVRLVQQANNYRRFADRVWIAIPVQAPVGQAADELRETDPRLFEYVIKAGLGVLACHRRRGRTYEVFPVQWPRRCLPDPVERDAFVERHYSTFEEAGVVAPRARTKFPRLR